MKLSALIKEYEKRKQTHVDKVNRQNKMIRESGDDLGVDTLHEMCDVVFTNQITITAIDDFLTELKKVTEL